MNNMNNNMNNSENQIELNRGISFIFTQESMTQNCF